LIGKRELMRRWRLGHRRQRCCRPGAFGGRSVAHGTFAGLHRLESSGSSGEPAFVQDTVMAVYDALRPAPCAADPLRRVRPWCLSSIAFAAPPGTATP
jgi:hypothetical protein